MEHCFKTKSRMLGKAEFTGQSTSLYSILQFKVTVPIVQNLKASSEMKLVFIRLILSKVRTL